MSEIAKGGCTAFIIIFAVIALFIRPLIPLGMVLGAIGIGVSVAWYTSSVSSRAIAATCLQGSISLLFLSGMGSIFLDTSASESSDGDSESDIAFDMESKCEARLYPTDPSGFSMSRRDSADTENLGGGNFMVTITHRVPVTMAGRCDYKLQGQCEFRNGELVSSRETQKMGQGYFSC